MMPAEYRVIYFAPIEGLNDEDAEAARVANRANLHLGVQDAKVTYVGPMTSGALGIETAYFLRQFTPPRLYVNHVEKYANGAVNAYLHDVSGKTIGFIRVREQEPVAA
jgi:hypothetical protein